jgi:integrase
MRATSYNKHRRHLRALINFALAEGQIQTQPFVKVGPAPVGVKRPKTVPSSWYKRTMALLDSDSVSGLNPTKFWRVVFSVMHFTSMRRRQVVELKWEHVLLARSALLMSSDGSKSRREWLVPVPAWINQALRDLRSEIELKSGLAVRPYDQVFCLPLISPSRIKSPTMLDEHISRAFESLSRHLGYKVSAHRVRHTSATVMLERSGNIKAVSDMLGHADIKLTASTYVHPRLGSLRRVQQSLSGYKHD